MRAVLHLLSLVLALPGLALAIALSILGAGISAGSWLGFFGVLLQAIAWLLPWGLLAGALVLIALALAGLSVRFRWLASACVALLAIGSSGVVLSLTAAGFSAGQLWFFLPAVVSASLGVGLAVNEWPHRRRIPG